MKLFFILLFYFSPQIIFCQLPDKEIHDLKSGRVKNDTSYIYWLPFEKGKKFFLVQGWESNYSHKGEHSNSNLFQHKEH